MVVTRNARSIFTHQLSAQRIERRASAKMIEDHEQRRTAQGQRRVTPLPKDWATTRRRVLARDLGRCTVTGCNANASDVDHVVPASRGGSDDESNLASMCRAHHLTKTGREARALQPERRRNPERHPGILDDGGRR